MPKRSDEYAEVGGRSSHASGCRSVRAESTPLRQHPWVYGHLTGSSYKHIADDLLTADIELPTDL